MGSFAEDAIAIPLTEDRQLVQLQQTIPGHPDITIDNSAAVRNFLIRELSTARLRRLYPMLFMVSNRRNISPLHHQLLNGRSICITERPDLHLVWYYNRIFVKPVPKPLFSYHFWRDAVRQAQDTDGHRLMLDALGFLRTYSMLIVHESDFNLAVQHKLLPHFVDWEGWCFFIQGFTPLRDQAVSRRYHYGEIRLTRLNLFHRIMTMSSYQKVHHNYATFFARFGAPYLFVFGAATVVLTALQTGLDAFPDHGTYIQIIAKFVPFTLFITATGISLLPLLFLFFWARELVRFIFCYRHLS
ncbi:UDP-N-acetylglucosamine transferase subunit ALG13 [Colletotrichum higginsianum IMI 349063]|uniref:UDP-N-acetylglucosamine transferase subunit ALG13 n=3 Tax=Colletotrichum higginsianum TaxID=80884 RepID=A0A1B7XYD5_COLHI|nr:UDP-N-acetylglucosamine transferase subunit ALG13 [Colletotrichum higginsianum IMI 349063]OBR04762.1 UDP-N-acetylglucosamine transferase subunit ALG13 [Colletotrichum higginsianum IMI 349063]TIC93993.1 hypothetical protein CH35J_009191 [Colletotrichum higginsianum]GJC99404.1 UDP-N-acetylglucosamine transferase subunit alg13 [Colletotrichum higginsianum]